MKKIAKILLLAMIISVFASACGSTEPEVFDMDFTSSSSGVDLEGANIVYKVYLAESQADTFLGYEIDTVFADMAAERLDEVEKNLNCTFELLSGVGRCLGTVDFLFGKY